MKKSLLKIEIHTYLNEDKILQTDISEKEYEIITETEDKIYTKDLIVNKGILHNIIYNYNQNPILKTGVRGYVYTEPDFKHKADEELKENIKDYLLKQMMFINRLFDTINEL